MTDVIELEHAFARAFDDGLIASVRGSELRMPTTQTTAELAQYREGKDRRHQAEGDAHGQADEIPAEQSLQEVHYCAIARELLRLRARLPPGIPIDRVLHQLR